MSKASLHKTLPLIAATAALSASGLVIAAGPAQALPPAPLAPEGCQQWEFPGPVTIRRDTGETVNFTANGPNAGAPADWDHQQGSVDHGNISGNIGPDGSVSLTYTENDGTSIPLNGQVGADGIAKGMSPPDNSVAWHTLAKLKCGTKAGPTITSNTVLGGIVIHVKDNSGETSQCHYDSEFFDRDFTLQANSTADLKLVPAAPLLRDWSVAVTCDNGASSNANIFF